MVISFYQDFTSSFHCGDCYYERDTGIGDFEERDSGNNHLNEPRTGMSVNESLYRLSRIRGGRAAQRHSSVIAREQKFYEKRSC